MRALLLAATVSLTTTVLPVSAAQALDPPGAALVSGNANGVKIHRGGGFNDHRRGFPVVGDRDRFRNVRTEVDMVTYGGEWALYNNRTWESDSYNDWWHDQPWRSYPKWVSTNQNCDRMWWSGGGWRC